MAQKVKKDICLVAAIDFGTTFSGYAYQFKSDNESDRTKIYANQKWEGHKQLSQKTTTSILFNEKKEFDSFGYPAETKYAQKVKKKEKEKWYFFKQFKMMLGEQKITRQMSIEARNGKHMKAMSVFGASIRYMKEQLLEKLIEKGTGVECDEIHWVLTVPAIWTDAAKQFMREAADEAGIPGGQLTIALEPEAASLYCQVVTEGQVAKKQNTNDRNISKAGQKFMVLDLGGGTVDITVQRREENGGTTELHEPSGGMFGGTQVDQEFMNLLISLVGGGVCTKLCDNDPQLHLRLMTEFERSKREFSSNIDEITLTVPVKLSQYYKEETNEDIEIAIQRSPHKDTVEWFDDSLCLQGEKMKEMFHNCASRLIEYVKELMKKEEVKGTDIFLMVGGFSESDIMQSELKDNFPGVTVIIPNEPSLAVVKGAVLYGHKPNSVSSRRAKYTYGINISPPFDSRNHPESHRVNVGKIDRCRDVFKTYIRKGTVVKTGEAKTGKHIALREDQEEMLLHLYISNNPNPKFVDEDGCKNGGMLVVRLPKKGRKIKVEVQMVFGDTELKVEAKELENNDKFTAYIDFLL